MREAQQTARLGVMYKKVSALFLFFAALSVHAQTAGFKTAVNPDGKGLTIIGFEGNSPEIEIPQTIGGLPVAAIGESAFEGKGLTKLTLPEGIESIEFFAFAGNRLKDLVIPHTVTVIGLGAFGNNQLESLVLSDNLIRIETIAFQGNKLRHIVLPESLERIGQLAFASNQLTKVVIPDTVFVLDDGAFAYNELRSITLPARLKQLNTNVYYNNFLTSVVVPDTITAIGGALSPGTNKITTLTLGGNVELDLDEDNPFDLSFYNCYTANGKKKGTYQFNNGEWVFER
jgi:hypothetical protein